MSEAPFPDGLHDCLQESTLMIWFVPDVARTELWCPNGFLVPLGYAKGEVEPSMHAYLARVHPEDRSVLDRYLQVLQDTTGGFDFELDYRMRRVDGHYVWVRATVSVSPKHPRNPVCAFGITRVVPETQRLERSRPGPRADPLHAVMNEIGQPVVLMSANGEVVQANQAAARAANSADELAVGDLCPFLHAPGLPQKAMAAFRSVITTASRQRLELERFGCWWDMHLVPIPNASGVVEQVLLLASDVSDLKALERQHLESERALTLTLVREVHHRIKNHLQGLIGLLRMYQGQGLTADEVIERAISQVRSIATVHGLLARHPTEGVDLDVIVRETIALIEQDRPNGLAFRVNVERDVTADLQPDDAVAVALVIGELLMNAAKHTAQVPGAFVDVTLHAVDATTAEIVVRNGPASLPLGFSLSGQQGSRGGLDLIQSLLPSGSSQLQLAAVGNVVTATLALKRGRIDYGSGAPVSM